MADELSEPLVRKRDRAAAKQVPASALVHGHWPVARVTFAVIAVLLCGLAAQVLLVEDPNGGRPSAEVPINSTRNTNPISGEMVAATPAPAVEEPAAAVPIAGGPSFTTVGEGTPDGSPDPAMAEGSDAFAQLSEATQNGAIPRIGADGTTPFAAYARPAPATGGKPVIAIIVTGLGLNDSGTLDAVEKLPPDVTLAFAPYGKSLERLVAAARSGGREVLLEVPLEPFDYPDNDPGPQTLLTRQTPRSNLDKLYWTMGRFGGYFGLINHMGARFTASAADFGPVVEELGTRGLGYLDDGSSNRSIASQLAAANKVPFARADMALDDNPARAPILSALGELEASAGAKGSAIGVISALPVSIDTIAEWAEGLKDRGYILVPASSLMKAAR